MRTALVIATLILVAGNGLARNETADPKPFKPCVSLSGSNGNVSEPGFQRIQTLDEWVDLWRKHKGNTDEWEYSFFYDKLTVPMVDFERYMVIAIFHGSSWNCAGLTPESVLEKDNEIVFRYSTKPFQTEGPDGGGEKGNPYGFFVVPTSTKSVVLEEKVLQIRPSRPNPNLGKAELDERKWKQKFRFEPVEKE